jgi:hypothetical protein
VQKGVDGRDQLVHRHGLTGVDIAHRATGDGRSSQGDVDAEQQLGDEDDVVVVAVARTGRDGSTEKEQDRRCQDNGNSNPRPRSD